MSVSEFKRHPEQPASGDALASTASASQRCDECGALVEDRQRYCVMCGAHRRHVHDPAARYLSEASARARSAARAGAARPHPRRTSALSARVRLWLAIALIPVALAVGLALGSSSSPAPASHGGAGQGGRPPSRHAGGAAASSSRPSTGSSYVNSQNNLPGSVTVP